MTQKEFEERIQKENLKMKDFSLEIGTLLNEINILGIYNDYGTWKIYETDDRDSTPFIYYEIDDENQAFDKMYWKVLFQIKKENL
jgi:hypothetical protein